MEVYAAGAVAAFTVDLIIYPLDTLKTRYQSQDFLKIYASNSRQDALALRGLYHGLGSVILATLPAAGLFFSTYESLKTIFGKTLPFPEPLIHSCASAVAEMASCTILAPAEVVKQNAQMLQGENGLKKNTKISTSLRAFRQLGGPGAGARLFTGYTALVARNLPFTAIQFPLFEHIRSKLWESRTEGCEDRRRGLLETGLIAGGSAGSAGAVAAYLTTPSDVVKTRMMLLAGSHKESTQAGSSKRGSWSITKDVYAERGLRGFFRGGAFRSAWTALGSSLYLGTYDMAKLWLKRRRHDLEENAGL